MRLLAPLVIGLVPLLPVFGAEPAPEIDALPLLTPSMAATAAGLMQAALKDNHAYEIVESLTTEVGPRLAGTAAEARARRWAVGKLKALGFSRVRVEPFEVPVWERGREEASIVTPFAQPLVVTTLGGSIGTGPDGVQAPVIAFASLAALEAAPAGAVQGKIVFIDESMTRTQDGSGYREAVVKRQRTAFVAEQKGAAAALIRSVGTSGHRFAHTGIMRWGDYAPVEPGVPTAALAAPDADQLQRMLARGEPVILRLVLTPRELPPAESGNVIAEIAGAGAADEIVLVGAHLDSWDLGTGAIDDGAGVGIVVAAAALLIEQLPQAPARTIRVVLFGAEEVGTLGGQAYARRYGGELDKHIVATESDFGAGAIWRFDTGVAADKVPLAQALGKALRPLGIALGDNTATGGPDITHLAKAGVPVVGLKQNGWDYFDVHHTADDTLDKINRQTLDQNVAAYAAFLYLAAAGGADFR